jgi:predicted permease
MSKFLGKLALPALLFRGMATLDWTKVEWTFFFAVVGSKTIIFALVAVFTFLTHGRDKAAVAKAGLYGLFTTQSNDFALGLPIIRGVFQSTHPTFISFFYLTGPAQVAWINPLAFLMLEYGTSEGSRIPYVKVCKGVIGNPVIFMTLLGLVSNFTFGKEVNG